MFRIGFAFAFAASVAVLPAAASAQAEAAPQIVVSAKYQKDWDKGHEMEAKGLAELEKAKRDLIKHSADVVEAQNKRTSAGAQGMNAEEKFRALTQPVPVFTSPDEAARWARQVDDVAKEWAKYSDRQGDGAKAFEKSVERQNKAQAAVNKAEARIERGRAMKAEAERLSAAGL